MLDQKQYQFYKSLKNSVNISYRGYAMQFILATDFVFYAYGMKSSKLSFSLIKYSLFFITYNDELYAKLKNKSVIFSFNNYGNDYWNMLQEISSQVPNAVIINGFSNQKKIINAKHIVCSFFQIFFRRWEKKIPFSDKLYFYLKLVQYKNTIDDLENNAGTVQTEKFVPFLSPLVMDSILSRFFRKRNIPVYGVQHGVHCTEHYHPFYIPYDVVNIENFQADYMLAWGSFTKEVLLKGGYPERSYVLAGNPKYSDFKKIKVSNKTFQKCIVCLARDVYSTHNLQLLELVGEMKLNGYDVYIKMHPRSDSTLYNALIEKFNVPLLDKAMSVKQSIAEFNPDFVIVYNSTVYYEYYINNVIAFRFGIYANDIPFGMHDEFSTMQELNQRIDAFKSRDTEEINAEINDVISRFCTLGVNNYAEILNKV